MKKALCAVLALLLALTVSVAAFAAEPAETPSAADGGIQITTSVPYEHKVTVSYSDGGFVLLGGRLIPNGLVLTVDRFDSVTLGIIPEKGYHLDSVTAGGEDITARLRDGAVTVENIAHDVSMEVKFAKCDETPGDKCAAFDMDGTVYLGDKKLSGAEMSFDFGSLSAKTDRDGKYLVRELGAGRHIVTISKDGEALGHCEFAVIESDSVKEPVIKKLDDGTQLVYVPRGTEKLSLDFVIADDNGDGKPDVDPDITNPVTPPEGGFENPDPDAPPRDSGVTIELPKAEEVPGGADIPNTLGEIIGNPTLIISAMTLSLFLIFLVLVKKRRDDEQPAE